MELISLHFHPLRNIYTCTIERYLYPQTIYLYTISIFALFTHFVNEMVHGDAVLWNNVQRNDLRMPDNWYLLADIGFNTCDACYV